MKFRQKSNRRPFTFFRHLLSAPFIYAQIIPLVVFDLFLEIYHRICFPLYGIPWIKRRAYIRIDRQKLSYLNPIEKLHCMYCGYTNGWFHYATAIGAETEKYWCGIMHKKDTTFKAPTHHKTFLPYNDKDAFDEFVNR